MQTIGQKIKILIRQSGLTQAEFALRAGYNHAHFSRMLGGDSVPDKAIDKIITVLGIDREVLTGDADLEFGKLPELLSANEAVRGPSDQDKLRQLEEENKRLIDELQREKSITDDLRRVLVRLSSEYESKP